MGTEMTVLPQYCRGNGVRLYYGLLGNSGDGDSVHGSTVVAVTELTVDADDRAVPAIKLTDCYSYMDLSELKNITEHLLAGNQLFFSFVYFTVYSFVIVCFKVFPWHGAFVAS